MTEREQQPQEPNKSNKKEGMNLDFFENVYVPPIKSGSKGAAEFVKEGHVQGAFSYDPNLPQNQNPVSPLDTLIAVDLNALEAMLNPPIIRKKYRLIF